MSVELFRITDADVLRAQDVWESQCGYGRVDYPTTPAKLQHFPISNPPCPKTTTVPDSAEP